MENFKNIHLHVQVEDSKRTNNFDIQLIDDLTWESMVAKESLVLMIEEIPENTNKWKDTFVITFLVNVMVFFFGLAVEILIKWGVLYEIVKGLVAISMAITLITAVRHIYKFHLVKKRIYLFQTKPIRKSRRNVLSVLALFIMFVVLAGLVWQLLSINTEWKIDIITMIGIGYVFYQSITSIYKLRYINENIGFLLHNIQNDL